MQIFASLVNASFKSCKKVELLVFVMHIKLQGFTERR